jgi:hypothetical protein
LSLTIYGIAVQNKNCEGEKSGKKVRKMEREIWYKHMTIKGTEKEIQGKGR